MNIALVHPTLAVRGGAENVVIWLADELHRRGHAVTVFTTDFDEQLFGPRHALPFSLVTLPLGGHAMDPVSFLRAGWMLRNALEGFDWINPHNFPAYVWVYFARLANPRLGPIVWFCEEPVRWFYPEICNPHVIELRRRTTPADMRPAWWRGALTFRRRLLEWRFELARVMDRWVVPRLDGVVANSEFIAGQVRTIFHRPASGCHLGIPQGRFAFAVTDGSAPDHPFLLTVSRLFPEKNIETILRAMHLLKNRASLPFGNYIIAGDGPLRPALEALARDLHVSDVVQFEGAVSEARLATLYRNTELVVYLPLDETFGLVFLEAAMHARAVVGPNHGGPAEIVEHGVTGILVDPLDPQQIADGILEAMQDPERRAAWGRVGRDHFFREYTFSRFVDRFEEAVRTGISR